jgi:23S rRNA (adenine2030-N6)-methyltransferase
MTLSKYRPDEPPDYDHRLHAGNVGDVWKHVALVAILRAVARGAGRVVYLDTHAGEGRYRLGATGEWSEGIGRLWSGDPPPDGALADYLALCRRLGRGSERPEEYPGSPAFARAVLGPAAGLRLWERDETAATRLAAHLASDPQARLTRGDGLSSLRDELAAGAEADAVVALIDPSWGEKADWTAIPGALAHALTSAPRVCVLLWYPVKSLTRPNAMIARLRATGVAGTIAELITTAFGTRRNRLNGSGVLVVNPPSGAIEALAAAAPLIGRACATRVGTWSFRLSAWDTGATAAG